MSLEEMKAKTVIELRALCKERGLAISNHEKKFNKAELIAILHVEEALPVSLHLPEENEQPTKELQEVKPKSQYIETAEAGSLVAFKVPGKEDKVDSAKIIHRSSKRAVLQVENKQGKQYIVPYENVLWVRTGLRWPKGVYELLTKGRRHGFEVE